MLITLSRRAAICQSVAEVLVDRCGSLRSCKPQIFIFTSLGRPSCRWENNIIMELKEIGINEGNWVDSAQDRDYWRARVNATFNLRVP